MKKLIVVVVAALLAGCTHYGAPLDRPMEPVTTGPLTSNEWLHAAVYSIQAKFYDVDQYTGKTCDLVLNVADSGELQSVKAQGGDPGLCAAAIAATKQAKFAPLAPGLPHEMPLRFAPGAQHAQAARKSAVKTWRYKDVIVTRDKLGLVRIDGHPAVVEEENETNEVFAAGISQVIFYKNGKVALMQNRQFSGWMK